MSYRLRAIWAPTPRSDDGPVVQCPDPKTLLLPDWQGNNRIESLRNILEDGRVSLMFLVPGCGNVVRVNGTAVLSVDPNPMAQVAAKGRVPRLVVVITVDEVYIHCARAILRSDLWSDTGETAPDLPTVGELLAEQTNGQVDGNAYDATWRGRAATTIW